MQALVYISERAAWLTEQGEKEILSRAVKKNADLGVTGVLVSRGNLFLQVLEGPRDELAHLYARISIDFRHHNVRTVLREPIERRQFPDWSMKLIPSKAILDGDVMADAMSKDRAGVPKVIGEFVAQAA
jgi:hypothetical protein